MHFMVKNDFLFSPFRAVTFAKHCKFLPGGSCNANCNTVSKLKKTVDELTEKVRSLATAIKVREPENCNVPRSKLPSLQLLGKYYYTNEFSLAHYST